MKNKTDRERSRPAQPRGPRTPGVTSLANRWSPSGLSLRVLTDGLIWLIAMVAGALTMGASVTGGAIVGGIAAGMQMSLGTFGGLYRGRWRLATFDEAVALTAVVSTVSIALAVLATSASFVGMTFAVSVLAPFAALSLMVVARGARRVRNQRLRRSSVRFDREPVVVFGAGDGGEQIVRAMLGNAKGTYQPVAILDDDPAKGNLRIEGVPVLGTRADLEAVSQSTGSNVFVIAIPTAGAATIRSVAQHAEDLGLDVRVLPPTQELVDGIVSLSDLREISEADLLGRRTIDTDLDAIASYLTGQRVLVTGAGGSIGSELCRQISRFAPAELVMVDRDETSLHGLQLTLEGHALLDHPNLVVADIRDAARLDEVFEEHDPTVVFHAAALKHLPLLEMYAEEGWKTNVLGTNNVLRAAARSGVTHLVNVSTDKAADPTSVLGYTKRLAEQLTAWYANRSQGDWVSVRFGNVLGSRGSMLRTFRAQVDAGGPITVTHPDVTRFFMTPQEACQLVIQAGAVGQRGEVLVLDMGEPVRILDVAQRLAATAPAPIEIQFTGLRAGEKLHEDLISADELDIRRAHPLISHVAVPPLGPSNLCLFDSADNDRARESMRGLCAGIESGDTISL